MHHGGKKKSRNTTKNEESKLKLVDADENAVEETSGCLPDLGS